MMLIGLMGFMHYESADVEKIVQVFALTSGKKLRMYHIYYYVFYVEQRSIKTLSRITITPRGGCLRGCLWWCVVLHPILYRILGKTANFIQDIRCVACIWEIVNYIIDRTKKIVIFSPKDSLNLLISITLLDKWRF